MRRIEEWDTTPPGVFRNAMKPGRHPLRRIVAAGARATGYRCGASGSVRNAFSRPHM